MQDPGARPSDDDILEQMSRAIEQRKNKNGGNGGAAMNIRPMLTPDPAPKKKRRHRISKKAVVAIALGLILVLVLTGCSILPSSDNTDEDSPLGGLLGGRSETVDIVLLLTVLSVLPVDTHYAHLLPTHHHCTVTDTKRARVAADASEPSAGGPGAVPDILRDVTCD